MLKMMMCLLTFCCFTFGYSVVPIMPQIIDFGKIDVSANPEYTDMIWEEIGSECQPFNGAIELAPYFNFLKNTFQIDVAIETGTWLGETTKCLSYIFDKVHTMEIQVDIFERGLKTFESYPNIELHYGNSPDILRQILPTLHGKRALFYLDAHWFADWPLLAELELIGQTHYDNCIIVIDDFKVPGRNDIPYDAYDSKNECSYECIKRTLSKVYSSYVYYYVIPKSVNARAKFVAIPKKWANNSKRSY